MKPLTPIGAKLGGARVDRSWMDSLPRSDAFKSAAAYFADYPEHSMMSDCCRAALYCLVNALRPQSVVEIGTLHAGTTEVLARSVMENGTGVVYTTDPYGAERCPRIINSWPQPLSKFVHFY